MSKPETGMYRDYDLGRRKLPRSAAVCWRTKICASAIQVNMVNTSTANEWDDSAEFTVEALNEKYKQGWKLDIDWLMNNKPLQTHSEAKYFRLGKILF